MDVLIYLSVVANMLTAVLTWRHGQPQYGIARMILWVLSGVAWADGTKGVFAVFVWTAIALEFASARAWKCRILKRWHSPKTSI